MANAVPTLTGLATDVTFGENTVNAAPQLIDGDVSFSDADGNFDGGTLVVSGLLAEDAVSVRDQGNGAGQIGLSGGNVTYGGTVIGAATGGAGAALTVTFNASATSATIDALIQNLTYANSSDTPAASRTLSILVTDADGAHPPGSADFTPRTGAANPFNGIYVGFDSAPAFGDLDGDGDFDLVVGDYFGDIACFKNTGSASAPAWAEQTGAANPFNGIDFEFNATLALGDIDGDGGLDMALGYWNGQIAYFRNTGSATAPAFARQTGAANPFDFIDIPNNSAPTLADLDGDGDLDLTVGAQGGALSYFQNTGSATAPAFAPHDGATSPFNGIDVGGSSAPTFGDLDGDGDLDMIVGEIEGFLNTFENTGSLSAPAFVARTGAANPLNGQDVGASSAPALVDLDGDGDFDLAVGEDDGVLNYFRNTASRIELVVNATAGNDAPVAANDGETTDEDTVLNAAVPAATDVDGTIASYVLDTGTGAGTGIFTFNSDGSYSLDPNGRYESLDDGEGTQISFTYHAVDNSGASSATKTVTITVTGVNDAPVASDDAETTDEDTILDAAVPAATEVDGTIASYALDADVAKGSLTFNSDGSYSFDPDGGFEDLAPGESEEVTFTYYAVDDAGASSATKTVTITVTGINDAPTLDGLAGSVTFGENTVNAAPQLIDSDVSFSDADDNFDGGTLVVSGVLAEDTVSIRHQGNGAGQIGLSGGNITYGGTVIGTAAGGTGATLTVTFNASATSTAIDALIENLTYANSSDTPAASRTLSILVTDADGAHPVSPAVFAARTGGANPFNGIDIGYDSAPTFGDLDGDGDFDMALGVNDGDVRYFSNTGSATSPVFVQQNGDANPFNGLDAGDLSFPAFGDLDGDGDLDLAVGSVFDPIVYWMNTGSATAPAFARQTGSNDPFDAIDITLALPAFADLDGDGDLDLTIGLSDGALTYFENTGSASAPVFTARPDAANPFNGIDLGVSSEPELGDLDGDGDFDVIAGNGDGDLRYLENTGSTTAPAFAERTGASNPLNGKDMGIDSAAGLVDLDGDGDLDAVAGASSGILSYFENVASVFKLVVNVTAENDAPVARNDRQSTGEDTVLNASVPAAFDEDGTIASYAVDTSVANGSLTFNADGSYSFNPNGAFDDLGPGENEQVTFTYHAVDNSGASSVVKTVTITVNGVNDAPVAMDDRQATDQDTVLNGSVPAATDVDGTIAQYALHTGVAKGILVFNPDGTFSFDPNGAFEHLAGGETEAIRFAYHAIDNDGAASPIQTIIITVAGINDAPVARADHRSTGEDTVLNASVPAAFDEDGTIASYAVDADVAKGALVFNTDGSYSFDPNGAFEALDAGESELVTFAYHAVDNGGALSAVKTVTIRVTGVNDAPIGADDSQATDEDTVLNASVPAATDVDGTIAQYALDADVAKGALVFNADGSYSFDPNGAFKDLAAGENEEIPFTYHAVDNDGAASPIQTIIITVTGINNAPVARADRQSTDEDTALTASIPAATDVDGTISQYALDADVAEGALVFNTDGTWSFNPNGAFEDLGAGESEEVTLTYHAVDNSGAASAAKTVTITVNGVNDAPVVTSGAGFTVRENETAVGKITATDPDDTPVFSIAGGADGTLFSIDAATGALAFKASPDFENPADADGDNAYAVLVRASDGTAAVTQAITVTVADEDGVTIKGGKRNDTVDEVETVRGQAMPTAEEDVITGRGGNDNLSGLGGNDVLNGGDGRDKLFGGDGVDILIGGANRDLLSGGGGSDSFVFGAELASRAENQGSDFGMETLIPMLRKLSPGMFGSDAEGPVRNANVDKIVDFEAGVDTIALAHAVFRGLKTGDLGADAFVLGKEAKDGSDRVIYDAKNGQLLYDADGKGGKGALLFARLDKGLDLDAGDFLVV